MPKPGGTIYAIGAQGTPWVKIGCTHIPVEERLRTLQIGQPFPLHLIAAVPVEADMRRIEKYVHDFLSAERRRGEWFEMPMDLVTLEALIVRAIASLSLLEEPQPRTTKAPVPTLLGQRIRTLRESKGMSQAALARALDASINAINLLEVGSTRAPHIDRLIAIADLFNVSIDYLVGRTDDPRPRRRGKRIDQEEEEEVLLAVGR